jgi:histidine triad (HIT) family protein
MSDCIFCKIVRQQSPASRVYEDADCLAFMDIRPVTPGHLLVIPKRHAAYLSEMEPEECARLFSAAHKLAAAVRASGLRCEGVNLHLADGEAAGQEIFHVHVHVFPRYAEDGFGFRFSPEYFRPPDRRALEENADRIRKGLGASAPE